MHPRARRAISVALSIALHALLLLEVWNWTVARPGDSEPPPMPVRIIEPRQQRAEPRRAQPPKKAEPPAQVAKIEPPKVEPPPVEAPPEPPQPEQPEKKLPLPEQIVQPPDAGKEEKPADTRFKSERDVKVEKQQVKRGEPKPGESQPDVPKKPAAAPPKPAPPARRPAAPSQRAGTGGRQQVKPPSRSTTLPKLDRLMPDALALAREGYGAPAEAAPDAAPRAVPRRMTAGNEGLFIPTGPVGTLDYLPDVREGNITLLNTKAEVFAPFVLRVAVRVFQNFLISLKKDLTRAGMSAAEDVEAEAVMNAQGDMISFRVARRSPRIALGVDRHLQGAANVAFFDRNPPPGARWEDGNIHFVFKAQIEVVASPQGSMWWVGLSTGLR